MALSGTSYLYGLWPPMAEAVRYLQAWSQYYGLTGQIVSGYRSNQEQAALYAKGRTQSEITARVSKRINIDVVTNAPAGTSAHNYGMAVDVEGRDQGSIIQLGSAIGFGTVSGDPSHLEWPNWRTILGRQV